MLRKLLFLEEGELGRLLPFFALYFLLFSALSLADGLSLTLFVHEVGQNSLPLAYGIVALGNFLVMGGYIVLAERSDSVRVFHVILGGMMAVFALAWWGIARGLGGPGWYYLLFVSREIAFTIVIMHFGTLLQDFFTRLELNRVLAIVYSAGRIGGILGGALLENLAEPLGLIHLCGVCLGLCVAGGLLLSLINWRWPRVSHPDDLLGDPGVVRPRGKDGSDIEAAARQSFAGFLAFVWASPLLFWNTTSSLLFMLCRWVLNFQYSSFFAGYFADEVAMARFFGLYTQWALLVSLSVQLVVVNRLVARVGLKGTHGLYSVLIVLCVGVNLLPMTFAMAVFARLVETELRFGLRNPIMQLITNKFAKDLRVRVRAWTMGLLNPLATLASSFLLGGLVRFQAGWIPWLGGLCGVSYFLSCLGLYGSFEENKSSDGASF